MLVTERERLREELVALADRQGRRRSALLPILEFGEAEGFLSELTTAGVIVSGGRVVAGGSFVLPYRGRSYHLRLREDDPPEG